MPTIPAVASAPPLSSRRRRLWELEGHAHCPVVGVCLPIASLRRLINKVLGGEALADDYDLHCGVITECQQRTRIAEAVQRELDRRFMMPLRQAAKAKKTDELGAWWREASAGHDLAGAFWAVLTHARCTPALQYQVLGEVHMLQHQVGMATRVELTRFEQLIDENAVLARELGSAQQRSANHAAEQSQRIEAQQAEIFRLRAELIGQATALALSREQLQTLEATVPGLRTRVELAREGERRIEQLHALQRSLNLAHAEIERQRDRAADAERAVAVHARTTTEQPGAQPAATDDVIPSLRNRAVLCVGGRTASVPVYRQLIERTGGRFLHHDGGGEDSTARLDATLDSADLVICQTGCISHDAYWRVKDHCKRTGKRCVFVETPSRSGLERALQQASQTEHEGQGT